MFLPRVSAVALTLSGLSPSIPLAQTSPAGAPEAAEAAAPLTPDAVRTALAEIERLVRERYFDDTKRAALLSVMADGTRSGRYTASAPAAFARLVTEDMKRVTGDGHMYLRWNPEVYRARTAAAGAPSGPGPAFFDERTRRGNHGLNEQRILPGNVRYLKIRSFTMWNEQTSPSAYDAAMRFLKDGDAAIIDLRGNGGGFAEPGEYLLSHLVAGGTLLHTSIYGREKTPAFAPAELPAGRMVGKPLYVLIDGGAASATEAVALSVDRFKLGELIGASTAGAGNRNSTFPVAPGFMASISVGTVRHGLDGSGWEGVGVKPHVEAPPAAALEVAYARALERLAATAPPALRAEYNWNLETARAALDPPTLSSAELAAYAGRYGPVTVFFRDGRLYRQRSDASDLPLTPVARDTFAMGAIEDTRLRFDRKDGVVVGATYVTKAGPMEHLPRWPEGAYAPAGRTSATR